MDSFIAYIENNKTIIGKSLIGLILLVLLSTFLKYGIKSIKKLLGFEDSNSSGDIKLGDGFELPPDTTLNESNINSIVTTLDKELMTNHFWSFDGAATRCEILQRVSNLRDGDLKVIAFAYKEYTKRTLRNDLSSINIGGTCYDESNGFTHQKSLIIRLDKL